jgi:hypothetical protein
LAWSSICQPLANGGLGFRSFESFNEAIIAKLAWWVLSDQDSFRVKVLKAKYKAGAKWLQTPPIRSTSFSWKGLDSIKDILSSGACRLVGSGVSILVWDDPWIPDLPDFKPQPRSENIEIQCLAVAQLMNQDKVSWNTRLLKQLFDDASVKAILNIP